MASAALPDGLSLRLATNGCEISGLAPPEYVILRKLEFHREGGSEKHLRDIRAMLAVSGEDLDRAALRDWLARLGLETEWRRAAEK